MTARAAPIGVAALLAAALAGCAGTGPFATADPPRKEFGPDPLATGLALLRSNEPARARDAFIRSLRTQDRPAAALTGAGIAAMRMGHLTEARRHFEAARDLAPGSVAARNNLGVVLYRLGEYGPARQAFRAAFALSDGRSEMARANLDLSERMFARQDRTAAAPSAARVERLGSTEYRLILEGPAGAEG